MKTKNKIDEIYDAVNALMNAGCWQFLDEILMDKAIQVWRTDVDVLLSYATATLPGKKKLKNRQRFMTTCKNYHPEPDLWEGLE